MRPAAIIEANGQSYSTRQGDGPWGAIISLRVTDEVGSKADTVEFEIDDAKRAPAPPKGAEVKVWLGWEPAPQFMGTYRVESIAKAGPRRRLRITAKAADLTTALRSPKVRSHHGKTLAEIAQLIASEHGLAPVIDPGLGALRIDHVDQQHESNLSFVNRLAGRVGASFKVADGKLILAKKATKVLPSGAENLTLSIRPDMVEDWEFVAHARGEYDSVVTSYRDDAAGERRHVHVGIAQPHGRLAHRDRRLYGSRAEAEAAAKAQLEDFKRGRMTAELAGPGLPTAFAEGLAAVAGFDDEFDGEFRIRSVKHTLNSGGFRTSLSLESGATADTTESDEG